MDACRAGSVSDMWSLGCLLCELASGMRLYQSTTRRDSLHHVQLLQMFGVPKDDVIDGWNLLASGREQLRKATDATADHRIQHDEQAVTKWTSCLISQIIADEANRIIAACLSISEQASGDADQ